jgi:nucleoside-diphosphate-sugar epimerase
VADENTPTVNPNFYGLTKYLGEQLLSEEKSWLNCIVLRLPGVLGRGAVTPWLSKVAQSLKNNQDISIYNPQALFNNMVWIDNLKDFVIRLLDMDFSGFNIVTLGSRDPVPVQELVELMKARFNSSSQVSIQDNANRSFIISIEKALKLGYRPDSTRVILDNFLNSLK